MMGLIVEYFMKEIDELHENHVQIRIIGDYMRLPAAARASVIRAMERTAGNDGLKLISRLTTEAVRKSCMPATRRQKPRMKAGKKRFHRSFSSRFSTRRVCPIPTC